MPKLACCIRECAFGIEIKTLYVAELCRWALSFDGHSRNLIGVEVVVVVWVLWKTRNNAYF